MCLTTTAVVGHDLAGFYFSATCTFEPSSVETIKHRIVGWGIEPIRNLLSSNAQLLLSGNLYRLELIGQNGMVLIWIPKITELFPLLMLYGDQAQPLLVGSAPLADFLPQLLLWPFEITQMLDTCERQTLALWVGSKIIAANLAVIGAGIVLTFTVLLVDWAVVGSTPGGGAGLRRFRRSIFQPLLPPVGSGISDPRLILHTFQKAVVSIAGLMDSLSLIRGRGMEMQSQSLPFASWRSFSRSSAV